MSNARKPRKPTPAPAPVVEEPIRVPSPDAIEFVDMFRIKAATGIDVLDPPSYAHAIAACLWFAMLEHPAGPLTWEQAIHYDMRRIILVDADEDLARDEDGEVADEDPTDGSSTPSSVSSSDSGPA